MSCGTRFSESVRFGQVDFCPHVLKLLAGLHCLVLVLPARKQREQLECNTILVVPDDGGVLQRQGALELFRLELRGRDDLRDT